MLKNKTKMLFALLLGISVFVAVASYAIKPVKDVEAAEACTEEQLSYMQDAIGGMDIPSRGVHTSTVPTYVSQSAIGFYDASGSAVGDNLPYPWMRSVHFYLPEVTVDKCALLYSRDDDGVISWGSEKIGRHLAAGSVQRPFVPSSWNDAQNGYYMYVMDVVTSGGSTFGVLSEYTAGRPDW